MGAQHCDQPVCLSVHEHISGTAGPIVTKFFVQIPCGRGSVLLWRRCEFFLRYVMYFRFMDDVTFGRSGPYGGRCDTGTESDVYECLVYSSDGLFTPSI